MLTPQGYGATTRVCPYRFHTSIQQRLKSIGQIDNLLLKAAEAQAVAPNDVLNLLYRSIESGEATLNASTASLQEIQRNWN